MNVLWAVVALVALIALSAYLWRLVARDGLGTTRPPRSHVDELGTWIERELQR